MFVRFTIAQGGGSGFRVSASMLPYRPSMSDLPPWLAIRARIPPSAAIRGPKRHPRRKYALLPSRPQLDGLVLPRCGCCNASVPADGAAMLEHGRRGSSGSVLASVPARAARPALWLGPPARPEATAFLQAVEHALPPFSFNCRCSRLAWSSTRMLELERILRIWAIDVALPPSPGALFPVLELFERSTELEFSRVASPPGPSPWTRNDPGGELAAHGIVHYY